MWNSIDSSTATRSIENYDFRISRSGILPRILYLFRVSFLTTLNIYKTYFKSHHTRIQRPRDLFSLWEATAFVRHRVLWPSVSRSSLLMKWRTLQPTTSVQVAGSHILRSMQMVTNWRFVHQGKEDYYKIKSNWVLERMFNYRLVFQDKPGYLVRFLILVLAWLLISRFLEVMNLKSPSGIFTLREIFPICQQITVSI